MSLNHVKLWYNSFRSNYWKIGTNCEKDIDECAPKPCKNGKCIDGIADFDCDCDPGYEGDLCEIEINECERFKPCDHGTCTGMA